MSKRKPPKHDPLWAKAKTLCRLNMEDIRMAKELGLSPKTLMKNIPASSQKWKLPVKLWVRELHEKRFGPRTTQRLEQERTPESLEQIFTESPAENDIPF